MTQLGWGNLARPGWDTSPVRSAFIPQYEKHGTANGEYLSLMAGVGVIPYSEKGDIGNKAPEDMSKCKVVRKGDFVINSMNFGIGSFGLSSLDGICSPVYLVLRPNGHKFNPSFVNYIFQNQDFQRFAQSFGNGILAHRAAVGWDELKNIALPLPSLDEQKAIADFLDHELAQIDALMAKQEKLAEIAFKRMVSLTDKLIWQNRGSTDNFELIRLGAHVSLISEKCDHENRISLDQIESWTGRRIAAQNEEQSDHEVQVGVKFEAQDVLFGKLRPYLAKVWVAESKGSALGDIYVLRSTKLVPSYLKNLFLSKRLIDLIDATSYGTKMPRASWDTIKTISIPVLAQDDQLEIVKQIEAQRAKTDRLISELRIFSRNLNDRRQSLISAAVTGKIDVRKAG